MNYRIVLLPAVNHRILKLETSDYQTIASAISSLGIEPRPHNVKKLVGSSLWRVRTRDFRIVYSIDDDKKLVAVVRLTRRNEGSYKGL